MNSKSKTLTSKIIQNIYGEHVIYFVIQLILIINVSSIKQTFKKEFSFEKSGILITLYSRNC